MNIVILHGWGQNAGFWKNLTDKLGKNARSFDMPGFGDEAIVNPNWGVPEYADWVIKKIKKRKDIVLIGHSFGGRITAEIAGKKPRWLKGIVLSGAPCLYKPTLKTRFRIITYKFLKLFIPKNLRSIFFTIDLKKARDKGLEKVFRNVVVYDQTKQLENINIPTLLIWGENDTTVPLYIAKEIKKIIKNSDLRIIDNAGHNSNFDNPNLFYGYVKKFIENI